MLFSVLQCSLISDPCWGSSLCLPQAQGSSSSTEFGKAGRAPEVTCGNGAVTLAAGKGEWILPALGAGKHPAALTAGQVTMVMRAIKQMEINICIMPFRHDLTKKW